MERRKRFSKKSVKKGETSRDKEKEKSKKKDQGSVCYECKKSGHMRYDYPLIKSFMRKKMKKALFKAWTDKESSSSSSSDGEEHTNIANFCLMAHEDDEVQSSDPLYDFTFDELMSAFNDLMFEFKKAGNRITKLKVINENLLKENNEYSNKNNSLRNKFDSLSSKYMSHEKKNEAYINDNKSIGSDNINL